MYQEEPDSGDTFNYGETIDFEYSVAANTDGEVSLRINNDYTGTIQTKCTHDHPDVDQTRTYDCSVNDLEPGDHSWQVRFDDDDSPDADWTSYQDFTVEEPQEPDPEVDSPSDGATFDEGETIDLEGVVSSYDESGTATLYVDGSSEETQSFSSFSSTPIDHSDTYSPGTYDWYIEAETEFHTETSSTHTFEVEEDDDNGDDPDPDPDPPTVYLEKPSDGSTFTEDTEIDLEAMVESDEEDGTATLYVDGSEEYSQSFSSWSSTPIDHSDAFSPGTYDWYVEADTSEHTINSETWSFTVEEEDPDPPEVELDNPSDGATLSEGSIDFNGTVYGDEEDGTATIYLDNEEIHEDSFTSYSSNPIEHSEILSEGEYDWYIEAATDEHTVDSDTWTLTMEDPSVYIDLVSPDNSEIIDGTETSVDLEFEIENVNTSSNWEIFVNNQSIDTGLVGEDETTVESVSVPVDVGEDYEWFVEAEDDNDEIHTSEDRIFTVGDEVDEPEIRTLTAEYDLEQETTLLTFELLSDGNLEGYAGSGEEIEFTDEKLQLEYPGLNVSDTYEIIDSNNQTDSTTVDLQAFDTDLRPSTESTQTLDTQTLERQFSLFNEGDLPVNYEIELVGEGDPVTETEFSDAVDPGVENTETSEWNVSNLEYDVGSPEPIEDRVVLGEEFDVETSVEINNTGEFDFETVEPQSTDSEDSGVCDISTLSIPGIDAGASLHDDLQFPCESGEYYNDEVETGETGNDQENVTISFDFDVYSNLTRQSELMLEFPISGVPGWDEREEDTVETSVNGSTHNISTETTVKDVQFVIGDNHSTSSLQEGHYNGQLYYETEDTDTTDPSPPPSSGGPTIIGNVTGEEYEWSVTAYGTFDHEQFEIVATPEREFERRLFIENTGDTDVELQLQCISESDICDWVELSQSELELDTELETEKTVTVSGEIPATATSGDDFDFGVFITDPSYDPDSDSNDGSSTVDFIVSIDPIFGAILEGIQSLFEWREIEPPFEDAEPIPYPFVIFPIGISVVAFVIMTGLEKAARSDGHMLIKFFISSAIFILAVGLF